MSRRLFCAIGNLHCSCKNAAYSSHSVPTFSTSFATRLSSSNASTSKTTDNSMPNNTSHSNPASLLNLTPQTQFYRRILPKSCISFCSDEGKKIFREALLTGHMDGYFQLAAQFRTQDEPAFCGLSTLVMVLNTLEVDPKRVWKGPWRWYHENMLDCCIPLEIIEKNGITMDQFACLAACNMLNVKLVHVNELASEVRFRELVRLVTKRTDQVLVVSYSRAVLQQSGDGHFSPIGGYHVDRDMVLIMDTARFKYPPHWVSLSLLFQSMQKIDQTSGLSRGYFLLSRNQVSPGLLFRLSSDFSPVGMDSKLSAFLHSWEKLLTTDISCSDLIGTDIAELTALQLVRSLSLIDQEAHLITTQLNSAFAEEISYHRYARNVQQMLKSLESLPIYDIIYTRTIYTERSTLDRAGSQNQNLMSTVESNEKPKEALANIGMLTPTHFLTMFLLSWPYHRCTESTFGTALHKYTSSQLARPDCELLQNESSRLKQQLASIISYAKGCCHSCNNNV